MVKSYVDRNEYKFLENRKKFLLFALCVICVGVIFNIFRGVKLDIKFTGGAMLKYSYALDKSVSDSDVSASDYMKLDKANVASVVKEVTGKDSTITIAQSATSEGGVKNTVTVSMSGKKTISEDAGEQVAEKLTEIYPKVKFSLIESNSVDATTGSEFFGKCLVAVILAAVFMIIYDDNFIAVLLTIIGYSINSTIIIYDRIRENRGIMGSKATYAELANRSLNETLGRTINTNLTLVAAVLTIVVVAYIYDIRSIITFAVPMMAGVIAGAYSSMFISNSLWVTWREYRDRKLALDKVASFNSGKKKK